MTLILFISPIRNHSTVRSLLCTGRKLCRTPRHLITTKGQIKPILDVPPFTLYFARPLVTPDGGLILKGETFSDSLFSMRRSLGSEYDPRADIIHTPFGYIRSMSPPAMGALHKRLRGIEPAELSVRVRELRLAMSVGFSIVRWSDALPQRGRPSAPETDSESASL